MSCPNKACIIVHRLYRKKNEALQQNIYIRHNPNDELLTYLL